MSAAARHARSGAVTVAARRAITTAGECDPGDVLGAVEGDFVVVGSDQFAVAVEVIERLLGGGGELFTVVAGVVFESPALIAAWRAGAWPWPACSTHPKITSSTSVGFTPACSTAALMAVAPRSLALRLLNLPCIAPMGVRLAPTMTMFSAM